MVASAREDDWFFRNGLSALYSRRQQRCVVLSFIQGLVSEAGLPAIDNSLDVMCLAECSVRDRPILMEMHWVLTNEQTEAQSRNAEVCHLEEHMCAAK